MTVSRMIFSLNTGRCGTAYIYKMMATVPDVVSLHEPPPAFHEVAHYGYDKKRSWLEEVKIPYILGLAQSVYFESSAQFAFGFVTPMLNLGYLPDALVIHRDLTQVALSMWRNFYIPARSDISNEYGARPDDDDMILCYKNYSKWTDYQCCYWLCLELRERMSKYSRMLADAGAKVVETTTERMATQEGFFEILDKFGLERPTQAYDLIWNIRFNQTPCHLQDRWAGGNIPKQEQDLLDLFHLEV